jgi:copper chaperone NosL
VNHNFIQCKAGLLHKAISAFLFLFPILLSSCEIKPEAINYGKDVCAFCSMTAVDRKFGAELINSKGKILKFDCGECMLQYLKANKAFIPSKYLITSYENPGNLIDAEKAFYLSGGNINSPMGGRLAAFKTHDAAEKFQKELNGDLIPWDIVIKLNF